MCSNMDAKTPFRKSSGKNNFMPAKVLLSYVLRNDGSSCRDTPGNLD